MVDFCNLVDQKKGNSFLHMAAMKNYPEMVQYFIEKGANIKMKNKDGKRPSI